MVVLEHTHMVFEVTSSCNIAFQRIGCSRKIDCVKVILVHSPIMPNGESRYSSHTHDTFLCMKYHAIMH